MNRMIALSLVVFLCSLLGACGPDPSSAPEATAAETASTVPPEIQLNDGQKWVVSPAATTSIRNMRKLVDSFDSPQDSEAYQALRYALEIELALLLQQNSGPEAAYEQLRRFLAPLRADFEDLSASALSTQKQSLARIRERLAGFGTFFTS